MNFAASRDIIQNTPFPYDSMDRLRLAQQMTQAPQVSQEVQSQGGLAGLPVVQAGFGGFLRKIAPIALAIAAPYVAPAIFSGLGATGAASFFAAGSPLATGLAVGAGSGLGSLIAGARPKDALKTALLSGVTAGAAKGASNYFAGKTAGADTGSMFDVTRGAPETSSSALVDSSFKSTIPDLDTGLRSYAAGPPDLPGFSVNQDALLKPIDLAPKKPLFSFDTSAYSASPQGMTAQSNLDFLKDGTITGGEPIGYYSDTPIGAIQQGSSLGDGYSLGGAELGPDSGLTTISDPARDTALATNVERGYSYSPKVEVPDAYSVNVPKVEQGFLDTLQPSGAETTTPSLKQGVGQLFSDIKNNPLQMAGKAALIDTTVPDFEQMYAAEAYNKETQDLLSQTGATVSPSSFGTQRVVRIGQNQIPFNTEQDLQRLLRQSLGQEARTPMLSKVSYQADGGLITAARGGMFAAPGEFSGMVPGAGGGQDDNVYMPIVENGQQKATLAVSPSEYVVDSYTMAALGDGNPAEGAKVMDQVVGEVREEAYGTDQQPNATKGLSTLRSLMT